MAIEGTLQALLAPLASGRCAPLVNLSPTVTLPYITFQMTGAAPGVLASPNGLGAKKFQIDLFAATYAAAKGLAQTVIAAMNTASFANALTFSFDDYEEGAEVFRVVLEYTIWTT